jgi:hypothetical protein
VFREENKTWSGVDVALQQEYLPNGKGLLVVLRSFLDRGARDDADGVMCVAACLFKPPKYKQFVRRWNQMLARIKPGGVPYFHATDFFPGGGIYRGIPHQHRNAIAATLPALLNEHLYQVVAVTFHEDEFNRVASEQWKERFGSLYGVAVQMCAGALGHWANRHNYFGSIAYFCEAGQDEQPDANRVFNAMSADDALSRHIRYESHGFGRKGTIRGLEAADYFAWHWNKLDAETISRGRAHPEFREWRRDFRALVFENPDKYLVYQYTGDRLAEFVRYMWHDRGADVQLVRLPPPLRPERSDE